MKTGRDIAPILISLEKAVAKLGPLPADASLRQRWQQRLAAGEPALDEADFPVAEAALLLVDVVSACEGKTLLLSTAEQLVAEYLSEQSAPGGLEGCGIEAELGDVYIHLSCQTALARTGAAVAEAASVDGWNKRHCPVCGADPAFSCFDKEGGRRMLICGACLTSWRYKRLGCTCCGEEQPDRLKVLTADEFPGWSVGICLTCHGYIKTADLRQLAAVPRWQKAALDTLPLDYAATKWLAGETPGTISSPKEGMS
ncbi:MAG: formate dehydrogenase accessory protein FdhE [Negativicutes bacterium]|nr:formate dehydrogenase accessory protein FdhE [Negativicutes bacterium]